MTDPLTSLRTFREFPPGLAAGSPCAVVIDIDSLLWLNDQLGFEAGDSALVSVASSITQCLDSEPAASVYRIGGDEFLAVLPDATSLEAELTARALVTAIRRLNIPYRRIDQPSRTNLESNAAVIRISPGFLRNAFGPQGLVEHCQDWIAQAVYREKQRTGTVGVVVNLASENWAA